MNNYLITGGAGFIGCATIRSLLEKDQNANIVVIDNLHPQVHRERVRPEELDPRARLIIADIADEECWEDVFTEFTPDHVYHLAAETGTGQSLTESTRHAMVNVVGMTRMLDAIAATQAFPKSIILPSSRAVYGEGAWASEDGQRHYPGQRSNEMLQAGQWDFARMSPLPFSAALTAPNPVSIYGSTKLAQEMILRNWCLAFGVTARILRLQNVYGPGQSLYNSYTGILSLFCRQAKAGETIQLYEDGHMLRDFVFIDDVADAFVRAAYAENHDFIVDIGTGIGTTIAEAADIIATNYGAPTPQVCGKYRNGDVRHAWSDPCEANSRIGWTAATTPSDGIRRLCNWIDGRL